MIPIPRTLLHLAVTSVAVVSVACGNGTATGSTATSGRDGAATIERVVDGDTIVVRIGGHRERVRLIGIDTPESVDRRRPVECFGVEASSRTRALLPAGTEILLERDVELRDRYDRLLAYVRRRADNLFVNLALVREGYASVATFPPNVAHPDSFVTAAAEARRAGRGLWSACE